MDINSPGLEFYDWEDRLVAFDLSSVSLFRVDSFNALHPLVDVKYSEIAATAVPISKEEALKFRDSDANTS